MNYGTVYLCVAVLLGAILVALILIFPDSVISFVIAGHMIFVAVYFLRKRTHKLMRQRLEQEEYRICIKCGYSLFGLDKKGVCPECGSAFDLGYLKHHWLDTLG
jgi:uncharacterized membrane protein YfcA